MLQTPHNRTRKANIPQCCNVNIMKLEVVCVKKCKETFILTSLEDKIIQNQFKTEIDKII